MTIKLPKWAKRFLAENMRYKVAYGGRGSGKSWNIVRMLVLKAASNKTRILCCREIQNSIKESAHKLISNQIDELGLSAIFSITENSIKCANGSEFIFAGLYRNVDKIKSMEGINICWIEEAQNVSRESWDLIAPTIRAENSEIWVSFNPKLKSDETYQKFIVNPPPNALVLRVNYQDNPFFTDAMREEMEYKKRVDFDEYLHIWEGQPKISSKAQVFFGKWEIKELGDLNGASCYFGVDWGFASDPTALIKCYILGRSLYIADERYAKGIEIDELDNFFGSMSGAKTAHIIADSARPETISYLNRQGYSISAAKKGKGSIEDGIAFIRSFERIYIHPKCVNTIIEFSLYSYKVDKYSGEITAQIIDDNNHAIDALRYALEPLIKTQPSTLGLRLDI